MMKKSKTKRRAKNDTGADPRGDVAPRRKSTIETISTRIPRTTQQVCFRSVAEENTVVVSNSGTTANCFYFTLGNFNSTAYASLFDQYRIEAVRISIIPDNNAIGLVTNASTTLVPLYCVIDYDDANNLASATAAKNYDNCVILEPGESLTRTFKPRCAVAAYSGAFTSYANVNDMWVDCASPNVQHFGVKIFVPQATVSQTLLQSWHFVVEGWISFRSVF